MNETSGTFSWIDYTVFSGMLGLSVAIGVYFGFFGPKQNSKDVYILGGKDMNVIPVAMSLIASQISGISLLAIPADVYLYGLNYIWVLALIPIICLISVYIYLPVLYDLQFTSIYEYFSLRFDKKIRVLSSFLYTITVFVNCPLITYIPSLAFAQVSGINVHYITLVVCAICIFYTTIGGLKAVVWTDALQFIGIVVSVFAVFVLGILAAGGIGEVWEIADKGQRLDLSFSIDPTLRDSFWTIFIGGFFNYVPFLTLNQGSMQKYKSLPTVRSTVALVLYSTGYVVLAATTVLTGCVIYANYWNCDPLTNNQIQQSDQLVPYLLMNVAGQIPAIPGVFIAGVFSASLSSLSANLNTISSTIYEDFILPFLPTTTTERTASIILKVIVIISGIITIALIFLYERMGSIFPIFVALQGVANGPLLALFTLGILCPFVNSKGALIGGITGLVCGGWIAIGHQWYSIQGLLRTYAKPISVEGCNSTFNQTAEPSAIFEEPFILYRLSIWYNALVGTLVCCVIAITTSLLTKGSENKIELNLISPLVHKFVEEHNTRL
ncbi:hypothetical protein RI129_008362 [Pyrocoelia pectoralis]|uniref:Sodium-coupled monocarboxylate transporter 1 n=1 Tax=Pyrocoelia pectoralis TaxID=417401 RepID=A0AAN7V596_9COLE